MDEPDPHADQVREEWKRRQRHLRAPQRFGEILSTLLSRRGYAQQHAAEECTEAWRTAAGTILAAHSRAGNLRGGVLEVVVRNSTVHQELMFKKKQLVKELQRLCPDHAIREVRFRVGSID